MSFGVVKSFDRRLGSGVVTPDDGSADVRVHASALERAGLSRLQVGDRVSYDLVVSGARGARLAVNLRLL
jgi:CspA family cold shock protein